VNEVLEDLCMYVLARRNSSLYRGSEIHMPRQDIISIFGIADDDSAFIPCKGRIHCVAMSGKRRGLDRVLKYH
jgi:hypothetical protein